MRTMLFFFLLGLRGHEGGCRCERQPPESGTAVVA